MPSGRSLIFEMRSRDTLGDVVNGKVVCIDQDEVLVDIGFKSEGVIPANELSIRKSAKPAR